MPSSSQFFLPPRRQGLQEDQNQKYSEGFNQNKVLFFLGALGVLVANF